jgi:hypothetical protein
MKLNSQDDEWRWSASVAGFILKNDKDGILGVLSVINSHVTSGSGGMVILIC